MWLCGVLHMWLEKSLSVVASIVECGCADGYVRLGRKFRVVVHVFCDCVKADYYPEVFYVSKVQ